MILKNLLITDTSTLKINFRVDNNILEPFRSETKKFSNFLLKKFLNSHGEPKLKMGVDILNYLEIPIIEHWYITKSKTFQLTNEEKHEIDKFIEFLPDYK